MVMVEESLSLAGIGLFPYYCKFLKNGKITEEGKEKVIEILCKIWKKDKISICKDCEYFFECVERKKFLKRRIDTESVEIRPFTQDDINIIGTVGLKAWISDHSDCAFDPENDFHSHFGELKIPKGIKEIRKRIVKEGLKIEITAKAYWLFWILFWLLGPKKLIVPSPPETVITFLLHKIGNFFEKMEAEKWLVNAKIVHEGLFRIGFPILNKWIEKERENLEIFPKEWKK